jgi:hypothetical protein
MTNLKEVTLLLVSMLVVLIAAVPQHIELPNAIYQLVQDKTNVMMLLALCFLVSYANFQLGVMMSVLVFIVILYGQNREHFENNDTKNNSQNNTTDNKTNNKPTENKPADNKPEDNKPEDNKPEDNKPEDKDEKALKEELSKLTKEMCDMDKSDTEGVSELATKIKELTDMIKGTQPMSNTNTNTLVNNGGDEMPEDGDEAQEQFESAYDNSDEKYDDDDLEEPFIGQQIREQIKSRPMTSGFDFDVVGCRYDLKGNLNNEFIQGPPVANCNTYDMVSVGNVGTAFYPINP